MPPMPPQFQIQKEETFEERMERLKRKQLVIPPRAPSGDPRSSNMIPLRKQSSNTALNRGMNSATPTMSNANLARHVSHQNPVQQHR